ncbi:hypothetical protein QBC32DRAFT_47772 [Pseudoneurospora amorphoporcata]|uniref:Uncharacterized protein n=1 Tax=Pseudoneurospora amorphoporcata TaxID=241081 RepID=A0AAN6SI72_9PEZI|nr:hypothetical protein QBC32DRAFT_47772 [Pseudoneurospora amorphoporcata]
MANSRAAKLLQWLALFIMALTASATITLDDIQPIISLSISRNCLLTYRIPIQGCTKDDFSGFKCSRSCAQGVLRIEDFLQLSCPDDTAPANSLLAMAMGNQLLDFLCPDEPQTIPTSFISEGTTLTLFSVQPERTTTAKAWPTLTVRSSTTEKPTESTMSESPMPSGGGKPPIAPKPTVTPGSEPSSTTPVPLSTTLELTLQTSDTISDTITSSVPTIVGNRPIRGGGGSPFDLPAGVPSGQQKLSISAFGTAVGILFLGALYL